MKSPIAMSTSAVAAASTATAKRAIVVGGSLGGLFSGTMLRSIGWDVDIYERSNSCLNSRGGGIVLQPDITAAFQQAGIQDVPHPFGVVVKERIFLDKEGNISNKMRLGQTLTSWNKIYDTLYGAFPSNRYHTGKAVTDVSQTDDSVTVTFKDGTQDTADLLVGADGARSVVRSKIMPEVGPDYSGYIAFRGLVSEQDMKAADPTTAKILSGRFVLYEMPNSHLLQYLVPGEDGSLEPGKRRFNWVWCVNHDEETELPLLLTDKNGKRRELSIPPGMMSETARKHMLSYADTVMPPPLRSLIKSTKEPFVQSVFDLAVPRMADGRIALIGDAAFMPRPHTASGVSKGAANAMALADALEDNDGDVKAALRDWEPSQLRLGRHLEINGKMIGNRQFSYGPERFRRQPIVKEDEDAATI